MKVIPSAESATHIDEIVEALQAGGLACIPIRGAYRILADARSEAAITRLAQSKRRAHNRPALIVVPDLDGAREIADGTTWPVAMRLAERLWPGPLTLVLPPSDQLAPKVRKLLSRSTGTIGVRVPDEVLVGHVVARFGGPLLVSSANLEKKAGAGSAAAVRQRFVHTVDVWVDAGDLAPAPPSTLVEITRDAWKIVRDGAVSRDAIEAALA